MFRFRPLVLALAFAATLPAALPVHAADAPPAMTKVIYLAVFGVVFDEKYFHIQSICSVGAFCSLITMLRFEMQETVRRA